MKIEIEIGSNLKAAMGTIAAYADRQGLRPGDQIKAALGLDLSTVVIHPGCNKQAIEQGMNVTIETKKPA